MKAHINSNDQRISILETNMTHVQESLKRIEQKIDQQFSKLDQKIDDARKESWAQFRWTLSFIFVLFGLPIVQQVINHFIGK